MSRSTRLIVMACAMGGVGSISLAQDVLPFPPTPSASSAGLSMQDSVHQRRVEPRRLAEDAPNILIIILDDTGPGLPDTYGGEIRTPTLSRVANAGISYNRFHSTAMCSPTRSALLTGRNHHRVGNGQITELANDWDGYQGTIPMTAATMAEVLQNYGYATSAFGKWHNSPANETSAMGPFDRWPTGYGFDYFYGFLAGEASQYEPTMVRNTVGVEHPLESGGDPGYHVSEDLADDAVRWLQQRAALAPDRPFFMYWAAGASHGPHHVPAAWADRYAGKFDDGWDAYRERVFARQKQLGYIPANTELTPRPDTMPAWASIPEAEKPFQRRLMEIFAGFTEHADFHAGRLLDEIERQGELDNTLVFYIWGDNGSSAEGQAGSISELLAQNQIASPISEQLRALEGLGGLEALGTNKTDNMYHAGWAWAGSTPFRSTKLVAAHFGGTRQPLAIAWPRSIEHDTTPRSQFSHVIDIVPTIYDVLDITPPSVVNGYTQIPIDGTSMAYSFNDAAAAERHTTQYFEIMGSRAIYHNGWMASTFGPRVPWAQGAVNLKDWNPINDTWELYNLNEDFSQASDLAASEPERLEAMKGLFLTEFARNNGLPVGGGLYVVALHPEQKIAPPYTEWTFMGNMTRVPETTAPAIGARSNLVTVDASIGEGTQGVLYSMGAFSGGLSLYVKDGRLCYEYNCFEVERTVLRSANPLPRGDVKIEVQTTVTRGQRGFSGEVVLRVNGAEVARGAVPRVAPLMFTANDCFDVGTDLGSPVALDYFDAAPYAFTGTIQQVHVKYTP